MPSCLTELGFLSNEEDNTYFDTKQTEYAKEIAQAIIVISVVTAYVIAAVSGVQGDGKFFCRVIIESLFWGIAKR